MTPKPAQPGLAINPGQSKDHDPVEMQRRINLANEIAERDGISYTDALLSLDAAAASDFGDPIYRELERDIDRFDAVVRAVQTEKEMPYMEALPWLLEQAERCLEASDTLRLSTVLRTGGVALSRVHTLIAADEEKVYTLAASTKGPAPDSKIDEKGRALLPAGVDPDDLLADPLAPKRAFRRARELDLLGEYGPGDAVVGEGEAYKDFEKEWRKEVDQGRDLVATLQLAANAKQDKLAAVEQGQARDAKIRQERKEREAAERRELEATARKLEAKFGGRTAP